jgi:predicted  nucleic acid-binding Zn-ribbon protein
LHPFPHERHHPQKADPQETNELLLAVLQEVKTLNTRLSRLEEHYYTLDKRLDVQYAALDKKMDAQSAALDKRIDALDKKIDVQSAALDKKIDVHREELKGEIGRLSEKMDGMVKRVDNQEILSRGATLALIAGGITTLVRFMVFPQP